MVQSLALIGNFFKHVVPQEPDMSEARVSNEVTVIWEGPYEPTKPHLNAISAQEYSPKTHNSSRRFVFVMVFVSSFAAYSTLALLRPVAFALGAQDSTPEALNPQLTNTIGDDGGPTLYYNGSGPVPP